MGQKELHKNIDTAALVTPAFVINAKTLMTNAKTSRNMACDEKTRLLYALKSFSSVAGLEYLSPYVDGFAASSLYEARLGKKVATRKGQTIHVTTPGLRADEIVQLCELADYISFNSIAQWQRFRDVARGRVNCGLRINPQLSYVSDPRYDPCRKHSKLGVPLEELCRCLQENAGELDGINGIHFHSQADATDLAPILATVEHLLKEVDQMFDRVEWINLGGGYLFNEITSNDALLKAKAKLAERGAYKLFVEPGAGISRSAGCIVSTVVDLFSSGGQRVAVLDTSINHMPEVFEYQFKPEVAGDTACGEYTYLLAGSSCLAGDIFGQYRFDTPLTIGTRVIFPDRGAYSLVKANMFNGINLPTLYLLDDAGRMREIRRYDFGDFLSLCGESHAAGL